MDAQVATVVQNHAGQYSIWPAELDPPIGWHEVGPRGTEGECLSWIQEEWADPRTCLAERQSALPALWRVIAAHAGSSGEQAAIEFDGVQITYSELMAQATRAGAAVSSLLDREGLVGVLLPNSADAVVAMLASMMAGHAFVPLDPNFPRARLDGIVADARIQLVITDRQGLEQFRDLAPTMVEVGELASRIEDGWEPPSNAGRPDALACVYYTSGSTGAPRGVMMSHGALSAYVANLVEDWKVGPGDRFLQFTSLVWATSGEEIFTCLSGGATLVIDSTSRAVAPWEFLAMAAERQLTIIDLPTVFWRELTHALSQGHGTLPSSLRLTVIGGENLDRVTSDLWKANTSSAVRLVNTYGSTEFGLAMQAEVNRDVAEIGLTSIGRPLAGIRAYVDGAPIDSVPEGTVGELSIGGPTLALGYLSDGALTAERFRPDPSSLTEGARCFRTRDVVEVGAAGELMFVGRADRQVKVRGSRVDLAEVESVLEGAPPVMRAVAVPLHDGRGQSRLVALVSGRSDATIDVAELRVHVARRLPEHAQPDRIFVAESVRLLPSGKKDFQAARQQVVSLMGMSSATE